MIAKLSLLAMLIQFFLNLSELKFPFSGGHHGVRIRRGLLQGWFISVREGASWNLKFLDSSNNSNWSLGLELVVNDGCLGTLSQLREGWFTV